MTTAKLKVTPAWETGRDDDATAKMPDGRTLRAFSDGSWGIRPNAKLTPLGKPTAPTRDNHVEQAKVACFQAWQNSVEDHFEEILKLTNIILQCVDIVKTKLQINDPHFGGIESDETGRPKYTQSQLAVLNAPSFIEDALSLAIRSKTTSTSPGEVGELSNDFTDGVRFACEYIRVTFPDHVDSRVRRLQLDIMQHLLNHKDNLKREYEAKIKNNLSPKR